jgi:protocatechuate 3,4-dioxygenase beta subunit
MYSQGATTENYLRGVQEADADGDVAFTSIFPGCYAGRWPHVHFAVYDGLGAATSGGEPIATSQLALPEDACNAVYATDGYHQSARTMSQVSLARDSVFRDGAERETPTMTGDPTSGYVARLVVPVPAA